ncbi:ferredoxin [Cupriavidus sp. USMAA2-4]|uniref:Ferredoxin n=1 Tax=Cupriavidus malaysiensis TaxID=367825 RepID=A0ABM6FBA8_9BURK|nr:MULTISPECIES: ferredoxin [Cupriavidus]AOY95835.1 ferredoxin [Cupriavidus sp. USMAA2-4]AOZ08986.1 ferredoxin [Cupriavidus malaysiensis]
MYVILTSKPGQFRTEPVDGVVPVESYDYLFYGRRTTHFVIAELQRETKIRVVEETPPALVNHVPTKFLERFDTLEAARDALRRLASFGSMDLQLAQA